MAINEDYRQAEVASEVEARARTLAHSTRTVSNPSDSYSMLGELTATVDHLRQVCQQLGRWHRDARDPERFLANERGDGTRPLIAADELDSAAQLLDGAVDALQRAHAANALITWTS